MRATLLVLFSALVAGCGAGNPCDGQSGVCATVRLSGNVVGLDQIAVSVDKPVQKRLVTPDPPAEIKLPAQVALVLPAGTGGTVQLSVDGLSRGTIIAHEDRTITLPASGPIEIVLNTGTALDLTGGVADMSTPDLFTADLTTEVDLAGADLSGADLSTPVDFSGMDLSCASGTFCGVSGCVDTMTSAQHCGACNHDCIGGTCAAGICQPFTLASLGSVGNHMATDGSNLYLRDSFNIYKCPLPTCAGGKQSIASVVGGGNFGAVAANPAGTYLYFGSFSGTGDFRRCALPACSSFETVATGQTTIYGITVDANYVYWYDNTTVKSCPTAGAFPCTPTTLSSAGNGVREIASDGSNIYWSNLAGQTSGAGFVSRCVLPTCSGGATSIATGLYSPIKTYYSGGKLYWLNFNSNTITNCTASNCNATKLTFLSTELGTPAAIAIEGTTLFAGPRADGKFLGKCTAPDCTGAFTVVSTAATGAPEGLLLRPNAFYWLANSGAVMGLAR